MTRALALITTIHRWLGVAFCLVFFVWFASGIVMVFRQMPEYSAAERSQRLAALDASAVGIGPADAAAAAALVEAPRRARLVSLAARPAYQFLTRHGWTSVYADTGERVPPLDAATATSLAATLFADIARAPRHVETITQPDQWTFSAAIATTGPLHRVALGDEDATEVYVSQPAGEIVMKTDRDSRLWGYAGAVLHWTYFTPLRRQSALWSNIIIYGSLIGCVVCLLGLVVGVARLSLSPRFRHGSARSPYGGWLLWHHYAGLLFGVVTFTWTLSGMLSMSPWNWSPGSSPAPAQTRAVRGGDLDLSAFTAPIGDVVRAAAARGSIKEIELTQFMSLPLYCVTTAAAMVDGRSARIREPWTEADLMAAALAAMPGAHPIESAWLTEYDAYYYDRSGRRRLPVLRVKFDDPDRSWLYLDAHDGQLVRREVTRSRIERWLYHGLHSLDFPWLYRSRPVWYAAIVALSIGGLVLSLTSVVVAWRYVTGSPRRATTLIGRRTAAGPPRTP